LMLSARSGEESRVEGIAAGADDYLVKPFSARELLARVQTHIDLSRLRTLADDANRRLQAQLMQMEAGAAEMERAARLNEMFGGMLGHDLRTPLSAIMPAATLLEVRADSERIAKPVSRIIASADRMERMLSQLLDFTRIRLGCGIPISRAPVDLGAVARS